MMTLTTRCPIDGGERPADWHTACPNCSRSHFLFFGYITQGQKKALIAGAIIILIAILIVAIAVLVILLRFGMRIEDLVTLHLINDILLLT